MRLSPSNKAYREFGVPVNHRRNPVELGMVFFTL